MKASSFPPLPPGERVAIAHDWLNGMRGGEKVLEVLLELFPGARLYTLFYDADKLSPLIRSHPVETSFLQGWPGWRTKYRYYLPLFPLAAQRLKVREPVDLLISTSHCVAKGVRAPRGVPHLSYIHSPMRYVWDLFDEYFGPGQARFPVRVAARLARPWLRRWDVRSCAGVDRFLCNSRHIAGKVQRFYHRDAEVLNPPADTEFFHPLAPDDAALLPPATERPYLVASALVSYKRVDLAIQAVRRVGGKLVIIGRGPERDRLEAIAGPETTFLGWASDADLRRHYQTCRAFLFPGEEDFGITPVEAMACGRPVIALGRGGALETVADGETGLFFHEQTPEALADAMTRADARDWDASVLRARAESFSRQRCQERLEEAIRRFLADCPARSG
jgi:glycosyltransferase involved in cell wall biosynthesis